MIFSLQRPDLTASLAFELCLSAGLLGITSRAVLYDDFIFNLRALKNVPLLLFLLAKFLLFFFFADPYLLEFVQVSYHSTFQSS